MTLEEFYAENEAFLIKIGQVEEKKTSKPATKKDEE